MSIKQIAGFIGGVVVAALAAAPANAAPGVNPPKWVAVAYSPAAGVAGWHNEVFSDQEAVDGAYNHCANRGGTDCMAVAVSEGGCVVLYYNPERPWEWGVGNGPSKHYSPGDDAGEEAYNDYYTRAGGNPAGDFTTVVECAFNPHW